MASTVSVAATSTPQVLHTTGVLEVDMLGRSRRLVASTTASPTRSLRLDTTVGAQTSASTSTSVDTSAAGDFIPDETAAETSVAGQSTNLLTGPTATDQRAVTSTVSSSSLTSPIGVSPKLGTSWRQNVAVPAPLSIPTLHGGINRTGGAAPQPVVYEGPPISRQSSTDSVGVGEAQDSSVRTSTATEANARTAFVGPAKVSHTTTITGRSRTNSSPDIITIGLTAASIQLPITATITHASSATAATSSAADITASVPREQLVRATLAVSSESTATPRVAEQDHSDGTGPK